MANLILMVERLRTSSSADHEGIRQFHEQRHQLIQEMVEKFDLDVTSWIDTHPDGRPREWAEIIIALGTAGIVSGIVTLAQTWIARRKISDFTIGTPDLPAVSLKGATAEDIERIIRALKA
jgi:hypothetical protein